MLDHFSESFPSFALSRAKRWFPMCSSTNTWSRFAITAPLLIIPLLAGCGGREARPVPEQSLVDDRLSCGHLQGEYSTNVARLGDFTREHEERERHNAGMILMAPLAVSTLLFLDLSDTEQREAEALLRRNRRLQELATRKGCPDLTPGFRQNASP